jgi:hypothetical protein
MPTIPLSGTVGLNASNNPKEVRAVKRRLIELGFNWLQPDTVMGPESIKTIMLFQAIKNGLNVVTDQWLQAANAPKWTRMPAGSKAEGFINDELADTSDNHDFGSSWLADVLRAVALDYKTAYHNTHPGAAVLRINDISLPRGGQTPNHATHQSGMCCDLKLPRLNGQAGGITYHDLQYDQLTARAMLEALKRHQQTTRIFFNDPVLVAENLCQPLKGHDNHIHYEIKPPVRVKG